jgi:hypothetical protein
MLPDHSQDFSCEPAGDPHFLDLFQGFYSGWHLTA